MHYLDSTSVRAHQHAAGGGEGWPSQPSTGPQSRRFQRQHIYPGPTGEVAPGWCWCPRASGMIRPCSSRCSRAASVSRARRAWAALAVAHSAWWQTRGTAAGASAGGCVGTASVTRSRTSATNVAAVHSIAPSTGPAIRLERRADLIASSSFAAWRRATRSWLPTI